MPFFRREATRGTLNLGEERDKEPLGGKGAEPEGEVGVGGRETSFLVIARKYILLKKIVYVYTYKTF